MKTRRLFTVERLESRETPSGMLLSSAHLATPAIIHGIEDANISHSVPLSAVQVSSPGTIRAFNPQPDPPTLRAIIAILPESSASHGSSSLADQGIIAI